MTPTNKTGLSLEKVIEIATSKEGMEKQQKQLKQKEYSFIQKTDRHLTKF